MLSHIEIKSFRSGETTWDQNSQQDSQDHITNLLPLTEQSGHELMEERQCYSLIEHSSPISTLLSFSLMGYKEGQAVVLDLVTPDNGTIQEKSVINTTVQGSV
jgi:hypothetical protein